MKSNALRVFNSFKTWIKADSFKRLSTSSTNKKHVVNKTDRNIILTDDDKNSPTSIEIHNFWLRDHCMCSACYNHETNQRQLDLLSVQRNVNASKIEIIDDTEKLKVTWSDDHESTYDIKWLMTNLSKNSKKPKSMEKLLWNVEKLKSYEDPSPSVKYSDFQQTYGLRKHLKNLVTFGISSIIETPPTYEATQSICERTSLVEESVYGKFWKFSNEKMDHADTAFTNLALPAHTDSTYYNHTAGYQVFHCLEHSGGNGGETLLVDGFNALHELKQKDKQAFEYLCKTPIPHHFLDKTEHLHAEQPIVHINPLSGEILQLRFNPCDRAPLINLPDSESISKFYDHYIQLMKLIRKPENELWMKLRPGTVLFVDNFRVLHGRASFTGKRILAGCYLTRDDLLSKARVFGLL